MIRRATGGILYVFFTGLTVILACLLFVLGLLAGLAGATGQNARAWGRGGNG